MWNYKYWTYYIVNIINEKLVKLFSRKRKKDYDIEEEEEEYE